MTSSSPLRPQSGNALLAVDVQVDFLPGGALAVPNGDCVVPVLNWQVDQFVRCGLPVVVTRDWHLSDHGSFNTHGGRWPPHCVQGTAGAKIALELCLPANANVVSKGAKPDREQYFAFADGDLPGGLRQCGVLRLFVGGLETEYCVLASVRDALRLRFSSFPSSGLGSRKTARTTNGELKWSATSQFLASQHDPAC